ncbi:MAG: serine/threonine dehydratase [Gammaproteobacteria bacterium]|nr:serine/threonine dehydratase [Gammaproteobacteria bacterium]
MDSNFHKHVDEALSRISSLIRKTPLQYSPSLSEKTGSEVYLKLENFQVTGSFKARGAANKLMILSKDKPERIITASSGNHGSAVANAAAELGLEVLIFLPKTVSPAKLNKIKLFGAEVVLTEADGRTDAETAARQYAEENQLPYLSPYNDLDVITGQATTAAEVFKDNKNFDAVFIAMGGGGLISGMGGYLKQKISEIRVIACSPENSAAMHHAIEAGRIETIEHLETLSDGTAGALEFGTITFDFCKSVVDHSITVSEKEIASAMKDFIGEHQMMIEGAAGVAIAGFLKENEKYRDKKVLIVICGGNISNQTLVEVLK